MIYRRSSRLAACALLLCLSANGVVIAQENVTTLTSKTMTFGAWSVRCETVNDDPETCAMTQAVIAPESKQKIFEVNFAKTERGTQMTIVLPLGIHLPNGLILEVVDWDQKDLPISFCTQSGCFVNQLLDDEFVDLLRKKEKAQVMVWTAPDEKATIPLSIDGFLDAFKKL